VAHARPQARENGILGPFIRYFLTPHSHALLTAKEGGLDG